MKKQKTTKKGILKAKAAKKAVPKKPEKKVKTEKAKPATAKKKTAKKTVAKAVPQKPAKKAAVKESPKKTAKKPSTKKVAKAEKKRPEKPKKKVAKKANVVVTKKAVKKVAVAKKLVKPMEKPPEVSEELLGAIEIPAEMPPLPVGYGESKLASMPVTPRQVYAYWEITEDTISKYEGSLNLKVINTKTNAFFYTPISERIGEQFISVSPATEYTVELGVINYKGEFVRILKSLPMETPVVGIAPAEVKEEAPNAGGLPEEFFETPEPISSY
jgi:hypothetical protein